MYTSEVSNVLIDYLKFQNLLIVRKCLHLKPPVGSRHFHVKFQGIKYSIIPAARKKPT